MTDDFSTETGTGSGSATGIGTDAAPAAALWPGDTGLIGEQARRALLELIKGPYLSGVKAPALWSALLADEVGIRSRLHELFLELVVDRVGEFAFVRNVSTTELKLPSTVRTAALTFLDTAMLLVLRQMLLAGEGDGRVIVGQEDVFEQLRVYRTADRDETDFNKRLNSTWLKMKNTLRVIHQAGAELRGEPGLGHRHPDRVGDALPEGPGGRLDAEFRGDLRMAVGVGAEFAEAPDLLHRQAGIAREMKSGIEQHRAVPVREHEPVAVVPFRIGRVARQVTGEQGHRDLGAAERRTGMPVARPLDRVEGEEADRVRHPDGERRRVGLGHGGGSKFRRASGFPKG